MSQIHNALLATLSAAVLIGSLSPASAQATAEQRSACASDAIKFCASEIPNTGRIISCLARQKSQISPRCRVFFDHAGL